MLAALVRPDAIDKTNVPERAVGTHARAHRPALIHLFKDARHVLLAGAQVQVHVLFKAAHAHLGAVEPDLNVFCRRGQVIDPLGEQRHHVARQVQAKARIVGHKFNQDIRRQFALGNDGRVNDGHVVAKDLAVLLAALHRLDNKFRGKNVGELGPVAVAPARHLFLRGVIVARSEQMAKDELGRIHPRLGVNGDINAAAVVPHGKAAARRVQRHFDALERRAPHLMVARIDQNLVKNLVQARNVRDGPVGQTLARHHPHWLGHLFDAPNVRVGQVLDVLQMRLFLILFIYRHRHFCFTHFFLKY